MEKPFDLGESHSWWYKGCAKSSSLHGKNTLQYQGLSKIIFLQTDTVFHDLDGCIPCKAGKYQWPCPKEKVPRLFIIQCSIPIMVCNLEVTGSEFTSTSLLGINTPWLNICRAHLNSYPTSVSILFVFSTSIRILSILSDV